MVKSATNHDSPTISWEIFSLNFSCTCSGRMASKYWCFLVQKWPASKSISLKFAISQLNYNFLHIRNFKTNISQSEEIIMHFSSRKLQIFLQVVLIILKYLIYIYASNIETHCHDFKIERTPVAGKSSSSEIKILFFKRKTFLRRNISIKIILFLNKSFRIIKIYTKGTNKRKKQYL